MGRTVSGTLSGMLSSPMRDIDWTLQIVFPSSSLYFATSPIQIGHGGPLYSNHLESVSAIRQTIEAPTDTVSVGIQNKDRVLGLNVAANWQTWRKAMAIVGRNYYATGSNGAHTGSETWIEMFRGAVQRPNADDMLVTFDIIPDTISPGLIVCDRTLGPLCPAVYKDAKTCAYSGGLTTCNHLLRSPDGCDGRSNSHHFMGFEHRYNPDVTAPGTGGNDDDDGGGSGGPCPRVDQFVRIKGRDGKVEPMMAAFVTDEYEIWNPKLRRFFPIERCRVVRRQTIWELVTAFGAVGYSSAPHPIIRDIDDGVGRGVQTFVPRERVLGVADDLVQTMAIMARECPEKGDVMQIEMKTDVPEEKIYCYGDAPDKMIVCHNWKPPVLE